MSKKTVTDEMLIRALQEGDKLAFNEIVDRYYKPITKYLYVQLGNYEQALDTSQDVFSQVFKRCRQFDDHYSFKSWLFLIARDRCADYIRRTLRNRAHLENWLQYQDVSARTFGQDPLSDLVHNELLQQIQNNLHDMEQRDQRALAMRMQGLTWDEISSEIKLSVSAIKDRISKIIKTLQSKLK